MASRGAPGRGYFLAFLAAFGFAALPLPAFAFARAFAFLSGRLAAAFFAAAFFLAGFSAGAGAASAFGSGAGRSAAGACFAIRTETDSEGVAPFRIHFVNCASSILNVDGLVSGS